MQGVRDPLRSEPRSWGSPALESGRPLPPLVALDDVGDGSGISAVAQPGSRCLAALSYEAALSDGHEGTDRDPVPVLGQDGQDGLEVGDELSG